MTRSRLYLSHDAPAGWLIALEFGRVDDNWLRDCCTWVSEAFAYLHEERGGCVLRFRVFGLSRFDEEPHEELWSGPILDAPVPGLTEVSAGQVISAVRALFPGHSSVNGAMSSGSTATLITTSAITSRSRRGARGCDAGTATPARRSWSRTKPAAPIKRAREMQAAGHHEANATERLATLRYRPAVLSPCYETTPCRPLENGH